MYLYYTDSTVVAGDLSKKRLNVAYRLLVNHWCQMVTLQSVQGNSLLA